MPENPQCQPVGVSLVLTRPVRTATKTPDPMNRNSFSPHSTVLSTPSPSEGSVSHKVLEANGNSPVEVNEATPTSSNKTKDLQRCLAAICRIANEIPEQRDNIVDSVTHAMAGLITADDLCARLIQFSTKYQLRVPAVSLLKNQLPFYQKEIDTCAKLSNQTSLEYVKENMALQLNLTDKPDLQEFFQQQEVCRTRKRRASTSALDHSACVTPDQSAPSLTPKRPNMELRSEMARLLTYENCSSSRANDTGRPGRDVFDNRVQMPSNSCNIQPMKPVSPAPANFNSANDIYAPGNKNLQADEEWTNIHTMLNCILSMVEKTRKALGILQQRCAVSETSSDLLGLWPRRNGTATRDYNFEAAQLRRQAGELIAHTLKATEDRVSEVKRKAEEAVQDVKRAAMAELQRALSAERARAERLITEARRQGAEEALLAFKRQGPPKELCWNCGRRASETCSGCNTARYCGTFCQHKHWEVHHKICGRTQTATSSSSSVVADIAEKNDSVLTSQKTSQSPLPLQASAFNSD